MRLAPTRVFRTCSGGLASPLETSSPCTAKNGQTVTFDAAQLRAVALLHAIRARADPDWRFLDDVDGRCMTALVESISPFGLLRRAKRAATTGIPLIRIQYMRNGEQETVQSL